MTEKRYILENESDFERARAVMAPDLNQFDTGRAALFEMVTSK